MLKRELLASAKIADGELLELFTHAGHFMIVMGRNELMSSRMRFSEEQLAELTIDRLGKANARILIGGYGMGFTYRAARAKLGEGAQIIIAEIAEAIVDWAKGPMAELTGDSLADTLEAYFAQSEQLPTRLYLFTDLTEGQSRAAGLLLQVLPVDPEKAKQDFSDLVIVTDTITSTELLNLPTEQMLHRLYHDEEVELFAPQPIRFVCGCSREKCESAIISLGKAIIEEHIAEGKLEISCDYCNSTYQFDSTELSLLLNKF